MKQIVFISGKGGTGKTTLLSGLARLVTDKWLADCDVETPNLHILLDLNASAIEHDLPFSGAKTAIIESEGCVQCGICRHVCRFNAISLNNSHYQISPLLCEGCAACTVLCPTDAIHLHDVETGRLLKTRTNHGLLSHARLQAGAEGSGKLVTAVRRQLDRYATEKTADTPAYLLLDGSPGIGCPVIASLTGVDAAVLVTEPTVSGEHDLLRILETTQHFQVPAYVCINKYDLNVDICQRIEQTCLAMEVPVLAKIPFDPAIIQAQKKMMTAFEADIKPLTESIENLWCNLLKEMGD